MIAKSVGKRASLSLQFELKSWPWFYWSHLAYMPIPEPINCLRECRTVIKPYWPNDPTAHLGWAWSQHHPTIWAENGRSYSQDRNWGTGTRQSGDGWVWDWPTTDVDCKALQFMKHQVLWSDPYHSPYFRKGMSFCVHCTGKVAEPRCELLKVTALGAWALNQEPSCPILLVPPGSNFSLTSTTT